ncbi:Hypp1638 [Branchiostoma lanceolatum]|uniref:Hypp1638 protein n=1 Tax=Branchiostoma lanceolatum TaxID=7740 RepID=A0A8J9ZLG3_BRALA|nr:Hypp1638 [Branchiostoma lanceolatum]
MLSSKWSRVVAGAAAGVAVMGAVSYRRKISAMPQVWKVEAHKEAFKNAYNNPPTKYDGPLFEGSFEFPPALPDENCTDLPFMKIDFKKDSEKYLKAVLDYCFDGNTECDFRVQKNEKHPQRWYNAPWMATRPFGREPIHGLTMERPAGPGYIAKKDQKWEQTWAVGFYNSYGAYTIGQFWKEAGEPTLDKDVNFEPGTVAFKLLFTQATPLAVHKLIGAPEWKAAIAIPEISPTASESEASEALEKAMLPRDRGADAYPLRLIQVDVMVRDTRSEIGWVFGTFMYHMDQRVHNPWRRLVPMTLQWGNDPDLTPEQYYEHDGRPNETWTNPRVKELNLLPKGRPYLGYLERANGIVDNFISSCASCHSTASIQVKPAPLQRVTPPGMVPDTMKWFRNIKAGEPFQDGVRSLDYSLQLDSGMRGYNLWLKKNPKPTSWF